MNTNRRMFLGLAVAAALVWGTSGIGAGEESGHDTWRITLDIQGMH